MRVLEGVLREPGSAGLVVDRTFVGTVGGGRGGGGGHFWRWRQFVGDAAGGDGGGDFEVCSGC